MKVLIIIGVLILLLVIGPACFIWGVNELLEQAGVANQIPWNFWTWLAAILVMPKSGSYKSG